MRRAAGIGIDIVSIARVRGLLERQGERALERILAAPERALLAELCPDCVLANMPPRGVQFVAGRWAAKEALYKAVGGESRLVWTDIVVLRRAQSGAPFIDSSTERLRRVLASLACSEALVSISHEADHAIASVMIQ